MCVRPELRRIVEETLLCCFSDPELERLVQTALGVELDHWAGDGPLEARVSELVGRAEREGRLADLLRGAAQERPRQPELGRLADAAARVEGRAEMWDETHTRRRVRDDGMEFTLGSLEERLNRALLDQSEMRADMRLIRRWLALLTLLVGTVLVLLLAHWLGFDWLQTAPAALLAFWA